MIQSYLEQHEKRLLRVILSALIVLVVSVFVCLWLVLRTSGQVPNDPEEHLATLKLVEGGPIIITKPKPDSGEVQKPPVEWLGNIAFEDRGDVGWLVGVQIGLRADGVLVWRRMCDRCGEALPTWDGRWDARCDCKWGTHKDSCGFIGLDTPCPAQPMHICTEKK